MASILENPAHPLHVQQLYRSLNLESALTQLKQIQSRFTQVRGLSINEKNKSLDSKCLRSSNEEIHSDSSEYKKSMLKLNQQPLQKVLLGQNEGVNKTEKQVMYNFRRVLRERQWLKDILLSESSSEEEINEEDAITNLQLYNFTKKLQLSAKMAKVNQYQYYSVGLLSRLDKYCEKRSLPKKVSSPAIMTQRRSILARNRKISCRRLRTSTEENCKRRRSVWQFIATKEIPKIQKLKSITRKENLRTLQKLSRECQSALEKRLSGISGVEKCKREYDRSKADQNKSSNVKELIVYCTLSQRQQNLYQSIKKKMFIDDHQANHFKSSYFSHLLKICDHPDLYEDSHSAQSHVMQLQVTFCLENLLLPQNADLECTCLNQEQFFLTWLYFAGFSHVDISILEKHSILEFMLGFLHERRHMEIKVYMTHFLSKRSNHLWLAPLLSLSLPSIATSSVLSALMFTNTQRHSYLQENRLNTIEVCSCEALLTFFSLPTIAWCIDLKVLAYPFIFQKYSCAVMTNFSTLPGSTCCPQRHCRIPWFTALSADNAKLKVLDVLLKKCSDNKCIAIYSHTTFIMKLLEVYMRYRGYSCNKIGSPFTRRDTSVVLLDATALKSGSKIVADILIIYNSDWLSNDRHLIQHLLNENHGYIIYRLVCKDTVEQLLFHRMLLASGLGKRESKKENVLNRSANAHQVNNMRNDNKNIRNENKNMRNEHKNMRNENKNMRNENKNMRNENKNMRNENKILKNENKSLHTCGTKRHALRKQDAAVKRVKTAEHRWKLQKLPRKKKSDEHNKNDSISRIKKFKEERIKMIIAKRKSWKRIRTVK